MIGVGDDIAAPNAAWTFGGNVPKSFDNHVRKSVPLYAEGHDLIAQISDYFIQEECLVYELGTSTGELLKKIADSHPGQSSRFIGIDREPGMIEVARAKCAGDDRISFEVEELTAYPLEKCDLVVSYYTAQFVRPKFRQELFHRIFEALNWGGAFVLFEKVRAPDARFQDIATSLYTDYKLKQGYSCDEIVSKAKSLKGVMEPFSSAANFDMLARAGFKDCMTVMKYICFEGILAIK
jgi:tRNA (cmo5U34)-methyltransferase